MQAYLMKVGCWHLINGTITRPLAAGTAQDDWDNKDEIAHGSIILRMAHNLRTVLLAIRLPPPGPMSIRHGPTLESLLSIRTSRQQ